MFGINGGEFVVILVVALVILGPERLPHYAEQLGRLVRQVRDFARGAQRQMREELGPEFDDIDWRKLDPRQYDPRRIVREALTEVWEDDDEQAPVARRGGGAAPASAGGGVSLGKEAARPAAQRTPFDEDAT
ncbi:sec-independent translocase [Kineococcus glutinatus]|uniref:Twin-arginine translocase TatA/TatE family subunit n=1 Tax=Kineococcus glutinatus TaxID=1070872 RepID=A0ABP9HJJ8_9ACTN